MKRVKWGLQRVICALLFCGALLGIGAPVGAQSAGEFSLQVSPSPLVATLKPGQTESLELKIRNSGLTPEKLRIETRSFTLSSGSDTIAIDDTKPADIDSWVRFDKPTFTVQPGQWSTQKIAIAVPKDAGFSYSFALVISRVDTPKPIQGGRVIQGSVAVFTLLNVDRPGAVRKVDLASLKASQNVYEFLPADFTIALKNSGNTILQPYGNIFIQQGNGSTPLATLPLNEARGYILPGQERTLSAQWKDGFPYYDVSTSESGVENRDLRWNFDTLSKFRFGHYTAKVVAVYNDGTRDVPIEGEVGFWVIPWRSILIGIFLLILLWFVQRKIAKRRTDRAVRKALMKQSSQGNKNE